MHSPYGTLGTGEPGGSTEVQIVLPVHSHPSPSLVTDKPSPVSHVSHVNVCARKYCPLVVHTPLEAALEVPNDSQSPTTWKRGEGVSCQRERATTLIRKGWIKPGRNEYAHPVAQGRSLGPARQRRQAGRAGPRGPRRARASCHAALAAAPRARKSARLDNECREQTVVNSRGRMGFTTCVLRYHILAAERGSVARRSPPSPSLRRAGVRDLTGFVTMNFAVSAGKPQDGSGTPLKAVQIDGQVRADAREVSQSLKPEPRMP